MVQLKESLLASPEFRQQHAAIQSHPEQYQDFTVSDDLILFKGAI